MAELPIERNMPIQWVGDRLPIIARLWDRLSASAAFTGERVGIRGFVEF